MANVQLHAAVVTKIQGLRAKLLKPPDYEQLIKAPDLVAALRRWYPNLPPDGGIFEMELAFQEAFQDAIAPIYLYYGFEYREILKRVFMRFEIEKIKRALRSITTKDESIHVTHIQSRVLNNVDDHKFSTATTYQQMADAMIYPPYRKAIEGMTEIEEHPLFHAEMTLDKEYFRGLVAVKDKLEPLDRDILFESVGVNVDLLNLNWIRRAKATFKISDEEIFNYTLSRGKRLSIGIQRKLSYMSLAELDAWIAQSPYCEVFTGNPIGQDARIEAYLYQTMRRLEKAHPMSIAPVICYLHEVEYQLGDLDMIVEARDYNVDVTNELLGKQVRAWR